MGLVQLSWTRGLAEIDLPELWQHCVVFPRKAANTEFTKFSPVRTRKFATFKFSRLAPRQWVPKQDCASLIRAVSTNQTKKRPIPDPVREKRGVFLNRKQGQSQKSAIFTKLGPFQHQFKVGESLRGNTIGATGPRASERQTCLWEGLWEGGFQRFFRGL